MPVESSVLASILYLPAVRLLEVEFRSGAVYRYFDVPKQSYTEYTELLAAESKGVCFTILSMTIRRKGFAKLFSAILLETIAQNFSRLLCAASVCPDFVAGGIWKSRVPVVRALSAQLGWRGQTLRRNAGASVEPGR